MVVTALVTGGAQRLGREIVLALARQGYDVAIHCNVSVSNAEAVAEEVRALGQKSAVFSADLLDLDNTKSLIPEINKEMGTISVLVNNASVFEEDCIHSATEESWERHINSNLRAPFILTQMFAKQCMSTRNDHKHNCLGSFHIINMIDQRVMNPRPDFMTYSLAKAGLWWLTRTTAQALAPLICVNAIGPGPTIMGSRQSDEDFANQQKATILERGPAPSEICDALEFILNSKSITGQMICVDGGQHLAWQTPDALIHE